MESEWDFCKNIPFYICNMNICDWILVEYKALKNLLLRTSRVKNAYWTYTGKKKCSDFITPLGDFGWLRNRALFFFFSPCSCFLCSLQPPCKGINMTPCCETRKYYACIALIRAFIGFLRNEKHIYLLAFHVFWGDFTLLSTSQGFYRGLHLYFLSPRPATGCADKDFRCIDFLVAVHRHQVPNVNIPLQAHVV